MNQIKYELKANKWNMLIWSMAFLFMLSASMVKYETLVGGSVQIQELLESFPRILKALFNMNDVDISKLAGYYSIVANYILLMAGAHGLFLGIRLLAKEEQEKTADFLLTKPRSRSRIFLYKLASGLLIVALLQLVLFVTNYVLLDRYAQDYLGILRNYTPAFVSTHLFFLSLGMLLATLRRHAKAESLGLGILLLLYFIPILAGFKEQWTDFKNYSPFGVFLRMEMEQLDYLPWQALLLLLVLAAAFLFTGRKLFAKKDIL